MAEILYDGSGHAYTRVDNIRITYVPARDRDEAKNWAGSDVLRIQAYKGGDSEALFPGAEFPVGSPDAFIRLISGLCEVYNTRGSLENGA